MRVIAKDRSIVRVVGADGCPGGWLAVAYDGSSFVPRFHSTISELVTSYPNVQCIGIDVPIGLAVGRPRGCDVAARRLLGVRSSSVFPAPDPRLLDCATHAQASELSQELTGKGVTVFAFGIFPKVAEVNAVIRPLLQNWIVEVHPEVSFWALNDGQPKSFPKGDAEGFEERSALLGNVLGLPLPSYSEAQALLRSLRPERVLGDKSKRLRTASPDDLLDAIVAAWSASRVANGVAGRLPEIREMNADGLGMEVVY